MIEGNCTNAEKFTYTANPTTASGRPASLDPNSVLTADVISGDGTVGAATANTIELLSGDAEGDSTFKVHGDKTPGAPVDLIDETVVLHVSAETASNMGGSLGSPIPK